MDALISLSGNVGTEVEFTQGDGWAFARFRLACTPRHLRQGEWVDGETTWITVRVTNRTAVNVRSSVRKGDPVVVTGKLRTHTWTNPEGAKVERLVVEATGLGHDLTRGMTVFHRSSDRLEPQTTGNDQPRQAPEEHDQPEENVRADQERELVETA